MEKSNRRFPGQVDRGNICALVSVACDAGVCDVGRGRIASVLPADDVIQLVRKSRIPLMDEAVFALVAGAFCNSGANRPADITRHEKGSDGLWLWPISGYVPNP